MPRYLGPEIKNALLVECGPHEIGDVLVVRHPGVGGFGQVQSHGIADGAVLGRHLVALDAMLFGLGIDGEAVLRPNGDTPDLVTGATRSSTTWTLTRDISVAKLHVMDGVTLITNGYRITARDALVLYGSAVIHNDGSDGSAASGKTGGVKAANVGGGTLGAGGQGGDDGGDGGTAPNGNGGSPSSSSTRDPSRGGKGGDGGTGVSVVGHGNSGSAGVAGAVTQSLNTPDAFIMSQLLFDTASLTRIQGGSTGGAGAGGGAAAGSDDGGGGGSGGAGGGVVMISCGRLILVSWTGRISADGGDGGRGAAGTGSGGDGGSGGGGGGGVVILLMRQGDPAFNPSSVHADGGHGGAATGFGMPGQDGAAGLALVADLSAPRTPTSYLAALDPVTSDDVEDVVAEDEISLFYVKV